MRQLVARMCGINKMCCEQKIGPGITENDQFRQNLAIFEKKKVCRFAVALESGLYMPKPGRNDASNGLILDHKVLQKCSNFFKVDLGYGLDSKIEFEEVWSLHHQMVSWEARGTRTVA